MCVIFCIIIHLLSPHAMCSHVVQSCVLKKKINLANHWRYMFNSGCQYYKWQLDCERYQLTNINLCKLAKFFTVSGHFCVIKSSRIYTILMTTSPSDVTKSTGYYNCAVVQDYKKNNNPFRMTYCSSEIINQVSWGLSLSLYHSIVWNCKPGSGLIFHCRVYRSGGGNGTNFVYSCSCNVRPAWHQLTSLLHHVDLEKKKSDHCFQKAIGTHSKEILPWRCHNI